MKNKLMIFVFIFLVLTSCSGENRDALYSEEYREVDNQAYRFSEILPPVTPIDDSGVRYNFNAYSEVVKRPDDDPYTLDCLEATDYFPLTESEANEIFYDENRSPFASLIGNRIVMEIYNPSWDGDHVPKGQYAFADIVMKDNHLYLGVFYFVRDNDWNLTVYRPDNERALFALIE